MTLCDTGPLVALLDPHQGEVHSRCVECLSQMRAPLIVVWPVLTEAMYFAGKLGGWPLQKLLWDYLRNADGFRIHFPDDAEIERTRQLMEQYRDTPMDLADASIVAAAEVLDLNAVFTLDSHFRAYRMHSGAAFSLFPDEQVKWPATE